MTREPTYEELQKRVEFLERELEEQQRSDEERNVRLRELETVFANAPDAFVTLDASHMVVGWNEGAKRIFGYSAEEALYQDLHEIIAPNNIWRPSGRASQNSRAVEQDPGSIKPLRSPLYTRMARSSRWSSPCTTLKLGMPITPWGLSETSVGAK